jgi:hypothetical protein
MVEGVSGNRSLTPHEQRLVRWMLEHGKPEAASLLPQLEQAKVTPWRCSCGCASIDFVIDGYPDPSGSMHPIADFIFGNGEELCGILAYEQDGILAGVEVYGFTCDAPRSLPEPEALRPFPDGDDR